MCRYSKGKKPIKYDEVNTSSTASNITTITKENEATLFTQVLGLSIPGYLELPTTSFRLIKRVAKGGNGAVLITEIFGKKEMFIAKVVNEDYQNLSQLMKTNFDQEVTLMEYLKPCKNIAKIVGFCRQPCCIIMKYYEKGSLTSLIHANKRINSTERMKFYIDISKGIEYMHLKQVIHCDLKPDNILVDTDENGIFLVLTDFGITQIASNANIAANSLRIANLKGLSVHHAAPEVFLRFREKDRSIEATKANDLYSFAVIIYELLSKRVPWPRN